MPALARLLLVVALLAVLGFLACQWLLPERYAVNTPLRSAVFGASVGPPAAERYGERIQAAEGFSIGLYAVVPQVRFLEPTPTGDLVASVPRAGRVVLVARDRDGDGAADAVRPLLEDLNRPHGVALQDGWLYVAETDAVGRIRFDAETGRTRGELERVITGLPAGGNHWTRTVDFGPDGLLYLTLGSSCNVCFEEDERRATMMRFRPDGSGGEIFARGLRNAVGFAWQPGTGDLYATDNGRDLLGDDFPPCELNRVVEDGDYGWPVANGDRVPDPDLGEGHEARIEASIPPAFSFPAHNAPLGITFLTHPDLPEAYRGAALVALHGSWNRTRKDGYEVVSLHWRADGEIVSRPFVTGFLEDEDVIGRPVDVAQGPDGAIYVSDDHAGAIHRVVMGERAAGGLAASEIRPPEADSEGGAAAERPDPEAAARGAALFAQHDCGACHLPEQAEPGVVPVPLAGLGARYDAAALADFLAAPTPPMPAAPLSRAEREDLAAHLLTQYGVPAQEP